MLRYDYLSVADRGSLHGRAMLRDSPISDHKEGLPPGPKLPGPLQALRMVARPLAFLHACQRRFGSTFTVNFAPYGSVVYLADPQDIRKVFTGDGTTFHTGEARAPLADVVGHHSLLLLDEDEHLRERKLMLPSFHGERLRAYEDSMASITSEQVDEFPLGEPFALRPHMQAVTLEVILRVVIGTREPERLAALRSALSRLVGIHPTLLLAASWVRRDLGPGSPWRTFTRIRDAADELLYEEIARRREQPEGDDMLSLLLSARDEEGNALDDAALRDELVTLLLAGHETTATGLAWAFERLVRHPAVMAKLRDSLAAGEDAYLDAVIKETLRVRPVVLEVARHLTQPVELAGHVLPEGTTVMSSVALVQLSARHWDAPAAFHPERFLDAQPDGYSWIPFGGGVRRCLGASFALLEMRVVMREVLRRVDLAAGRSEPERGRVRHVTFAPARGGEVIARAREPA
jgi:cytochrome P450 family 135